MIDILNISKVKHTHKKSFTLAEVLITLTIIGVIAALTIPTLIGKYEKHQTVVALKKAYSEINNAIKISVSENGDVANWDWTQDEAWINKYFIPYFKIVETTTLEKATQKISTYYFISGNKASGLGIIRYLWPTKVITLPSGAQVWLAAYKLTSQNKYTIWVDINGYKRPNTFGKDIFSMNLWRDSGKVLMYQECDNDKEPQNRTIQELKRNNCYNYGCNKNATGIWCGALIQASGWEITDDYPW